VTDGWEQTLTECEARLDAAAGAPVSRPGTTEITPFAVPEVTAPLPADLVGRARMIVVRAEALERQLAGEQDRIRAELRRLPRLPPAQHTPSFDDRA
jgi:hypothetical protein